MWIICVIYVYLCLVFFMLSCLYIAALWSPAGKRLTTWLLFVMFNCVFIAFPCGFLRQVWYLISSIPDLFHVLLLYLGHRSYPLIIIVIPYGKMHSLTLNRMSSVACLSMNPPRSFHKKLSISETVQIPTHKPYIFMFHMTRHIQYH